MGKSKATYKLDSVELLSNARTIAERYHAKGLGLTVRQLYYRLVGLGLEIPGDPAYKRLVATLSKARLSGRFPMHLIQDRGRTVGNSSGFARFDVDDAEESIADDLRSGPEDNLWAGRWCAQPKLPFVWVEKQALEGVFEDPCKRLGVGLFACKGYPSLSALWQFVEGVEKLTRSEKRDPQIEEALEEFGIDPSEVWSEVVILYFGDHDPDGLEIPKSALRNIEELCYHHSGSIPPIRLERVALTMAQIDEYDPPPMGANVNSSRYAKYLRDTGLDDAWELDALDPDVLDQLIRDAVDREFDHDVWRKVRKLRDSRRTELRSRITADGWAEEALAKE